MTDINTVIERLEKDAGRIATDRRKAMDEASLDPPNSDDGIASMNEYNRLDGELRGIRLALSYLKETQ